MASYEIPEHWSDGVWHKERHNFIEIFRKEDVVELDMRKNIWIDPSALCDLFLQSITHLNSGKILKLFFNSDESIKQSTVKRWLFEAGYFSGLKAFLLNKFGDTKQIEIIGHESLEEYINTISKEPPTARKLDYEVLLPCTYFDASFFGNRQKILTICDHLRETAIAKDKAKSLQTPIQLIYPTKLLFNTILPELLDNVRVHKKKDKDQLCAAIIRLRRREETYSHSRMAAEPFGIELSEFQKMSLQFWLHDVIEMAFVDNGSTIQDSFIRAWMSKNDKSKEKIPRTLKAQIPTSERVDGKMGNRIILESVFTKGLTTIPSSERKEYDLSVKVTGLHFVRNILLDTDAIFSIRSGNSIFVLHSLPSDLNENNQIENYRKASKSPYSSTPGVQFSIKFAPPQSRSILKWQTCLKDTKSLPEEFWSYSYPARLNRAIIIDKYEITDSINEYCVVICRARHVPGKNELYKFLSDINKKNINLVFYELPPFYALSLYQALKMILDTTDIFKDMTIPIITDSLRIKVIGKYANRAEYDFIKLDKKDRNHRFWWNHNNAPIQNIIDLFKKSRQYDSKLFWEICRDIKGATIAEGIKWTKKHYLLGGFIIFQTVLSNRKIKKLILKRMIHLVQILNCSRLLPAVESIRHLTSEVEKNAYLSNTSDECVGLIGNIVVTGRIFKKPIRQFFQGTNIIPIPIFVYPDKYITNSNANVDRQYKSHIRVLDWMDKSQTSLPDKYNLKPKYFRDGNSNELRILHQKNIHFHNNNLPGEMYSVWQHYSLLSIGHYSYEKHHYYAWIDLRKFINERSSQSQEMIVSMLEKIEEWQPDWIFYKPHEVGEALIERLKREALKGNYEKFQEDKIVAISSLNYFQETLSYEENPKNTAVFIDDGLVTGATIREARLKLKKYGFKVIHSMVILDRLDPELCLPGIINTENKHYSWWSLYLPPLGTKNTCNLCNSILRVRQVLSRTQLESFTEKITDWIKRWDSCDTLERFENKIESISYSTPLVKRFGDLENRNLKIRTSEAACMWVLEIAKRLNYYSFLLDGETHNLEDALSEALSGILLHYWDKLSDSYRRELVNLIINQIWRDKRESARSLCIVSLLSLSLDELKSVFKIFMELIRKEGIPNLDALCLVYTTSFLISNSNSDAEEYFHSLKINSAIENKDRKVNSLVSVLCAASENKRPPEWAALKSIGLPGSSGYHIGILEVLDEIKRSNRTAIELQDDLFLSKSLLDPIIYCLKERRSSFGNTNIVSKFNRAAIMFNSLLLNKVESDADIERLNNPGYRKTIISSLKTTIAGININADSIRRLLINNFVHYLPNAFKNVITDLCKHDYSIKEEDFLFPNELCESGSNLPLNKSFAGINKEILYTIIKDCLSDVKHPKKADNGILSKSGPPYMKIDFIVNKEIKIWGYVALGVVISNIIEGDDPSRAKSNSWALTKTALMSAGGIADEDFISGKNELKRLLFFPAILHEKHEEK